MPELVPIRYGRMLVSPFTFYRGAALIMAADLAATPRSGLNVQLCGDAHLSNFGVFASPERQLMFDINDFDETLPGPWEWDVKRLAASFEIAGRDRGFSPADGAGSCSPGPRSTGPGCSRPPGCATWTSGTPTSRSRSCSKQLQDRVPARKELAKAQANIAEGPDPRQHAGVRQAHPRGRRRARIIADPPLIVPIEDLLPPGPAARRGRERSCGGMIRSYRRTLETDRRHLLEEFEFVHMARKVVGVGSVGTRAWILLLLGRDGQDPLFLQAKEAQESVLERFVGRSRYANHGQRVVAGQRLMQAASDIFLGWQRVTGIDGQARDFYMRQLRDWKGSADVDTMAASAMAVVRADLRGDPGPRPRPVRATGSPSPPTWATATPSTEPSPTSPPPTPTRTSATTRRWSTRWTPVGSRPRLAFDEGVDRQRRESRLISRGSLRGRRHNYQVRAHNLCSPDLAGPFRRMVW